MENGTTVDWSERFIALVLAARPHTSRADIEAPVSRWLVKPESLAVATSYCLASIRDLENVTRPGSRLAREYGYTAEDLATARRRLAGERALLAALYEFAAATMVQTAPVLGLVNLLDEIDPVAAWVELEDESALRRHAVDLAVTGLVDEILTVASVDAMLSVGGAS